MVTGACELSGSIHKDTFIELCVTLDDSDGMVAYTDYTTVMPGLETRINVPSLLSCLPLDAKRDEFPVAPVNWPGLGDDLSSSPLPTRRRGPEV